MNIAFVTPEFITEENFDGGLSNYLAQVGPGLVGLGHRVTIVVRSTINDESDWKGVLLRRVAIGGPPLFCFSTLLQNLRSPLDWLWSGWKLGRALRELHCREKFDVVQYASYTAPGVFRLTDVTAVVRLSSYEPLLREASGVGPSLPRRFQERLERFSLRRADGLFGPSALVAQAASDRVRRPVAVIESPYLPTAGPLDEQPYRELLNGRQYLLFFGSLCVLKGVETIASIIRPLLEAHPQLHFVFVGKDLGRNGRPMMEEVWEQAGSCRGRVLYLGKMRQAQLQPILRHATGVVLPSRVDNLPNTCIEAMAAEKAVVGTRGASFEQLIEDGVSGLLCLPDDPAALLSAIERLLAMSPAHREMLGAAARTRVEKLAGPKVIEELVDFYRRCCEGRK